MSSKALQVGGHAAPDQGEARQGPALAPLGIALTRDMSLSLYNITCSSVEVDAKGAARSGYTKLVDVPLITYQMKMNVICNARMAAKACSYVHPLHTISLSHSGAIASCVCMHTSFAAACSHSSGLVSSLNRMSFSKCVAGCVACANHRPVLMHGRIGYGNLSSGSSHSPIIIWLTALPNHALLFQ